MHLKGKLFVSKELYAKMQWSASGKDNLAPQ